MSEIDKYIVWGKWLQDILVKSGYPKDRIFITGCHNYDQLKLFQVLDIFEIQPHWKAPVFFLLFQI